MKNGKENYENDETENFNSFIKTLMKIILSMHAAHHRKLRTEHAHALASVRETEVVLYAAGVSYIRLDILYYLPLSPAGG